MEIKVYGHLCDRHSTILSATFDADASVMLTYATTPGFAYHLETAAGSAQALWRALVASATNAAASVVTFTDPNPPGGAQRLYRVVSP